MCRRSSCPVILVFIALAVVAASASSNPVGWWKFDEGAGSTAYDSSGNNFNGAIEETTSWITGHIGPNALRFMSGYVRVSDRSDLRPSRFTVCAWLNLPGPQGEYARLVVKGNDNFESYNFQITDYSLDFSSRDTGGGGHGVGLANPLWPDEWIHIAGVYNGSQMIIHVNGEPNNSSTVGSFTPVQDTGPLTVGARAPDMDRRLSASVDDVRVYDSALSPAEIRSIYWLGDDPNIVDDPSPEDGAEDVFPDVVLSWTPGDNAISHDVYFGTDFDDVDGASITYDPYGVYMGRQSGTSYPESGTLSLELGVAYYWRIDEVNGGNTWRGDVWSFTIDEGKARNPSPANNEWGVAPDTGLSWTAGLLATSHDVYFGSRLSDVGTSASPVSAGQIETTYDPGPLEEDTTYYWRVDEAGDTTHVEGDIWQFRTVGGLHLKVDLGLPQCYDGGATVIRDPPIPGTVKDGWWGWVADRWYDMYMHDAVWERGENGEGPPPNTDGIAGSGVHVAIGCGGVGNGGFHVHGMCRDNLGGDGCPTGAPDGDPIANGWYHNVDWGGEATGDILMRINGLPPGEYVLVSYHNHWEPCSQGTRNCLDCYSNMPNMPLITAMSLPPGPLPGYGSWNFTPGTGMGVTSIQDAYDVDVTSVTSDAEVSTSTIMFHTDGSDVLVIYDGGDNTYPDPARPNREGSKAILNAFEIVQVGGEGGRTGPIAYNPNPTDGAEGVRRDGLLRWSPGEWAEWHRVYFGTDFDDVNDADMSLSQYQGRQSLDANVFSPYGLLEFDTTYYWRIDEVNEPNLWKGEVWSFRTPIVELFVLDDMESYTPGWASDHPISDVWIDGSQNWTGAMVWLQTSTPVHGGDQSMLYMYDSTDDNGAGCYSEAQRTYADPCDWIALGSRVLTLHFYGDPDNDTGEQMYVGLEDNDGGYAETRYGDHGEDMGDITVQEWQEWSLDLHEFTGVDLTRIKRLCIGFGDRNNPQQGGFGFVYFDDLWLYAPRCLPGNGPAADLNGNCIVDLADVGQMVGEWVGTVGISADLYPDDIVNLRDYALLVNNWLEKELWPPQ